MKKFYSIAAVSALLGAAVDFVFNGVVIRVLFHSAFKEQWLFLYVPFEFAVAGLYCNALSRSRWEAFCVRGTAAFALGAALGHLILANHAFNRVYSMTLISKNPILLRSDEWPQILFVTEEDVQKDLLNHAVDQKVPVAVAVVSDYGCIRSAVVTSVADVNVKDDENIGWTWRLNPYAKTDERKGPGMEDLRWPWCPHRAEIKMMENAPAMLRPWDSLLQNH